MKRDTNVNTTIIAIMVVAMIIMSVTDDDNLILIRICHRYIHVVMLTVVVEMTMTIHYQQLSSKTL